MGAATPNSLYLPARVYSGVTDPTDPAGTGTELGTVAALAVRRLERTRHVRAREYGGRVAAAIDGGFDLVVALVFRALDTDALGAVFGGKVTGGVSGAAGLREGETERAGQDVEQASRTKTLLLYPEDATKHGLLLYRAVPRAKAEPLGEEGATQFSFAGTEEVAWRAAFLAVGDSDGRVYELLPPADMTAPGS